MKLPKQVKPVIRTDIIQPDTVLNLGNSKLNFEGRLNLIFDLVDGANYNDPMVFSTQEAFCGCHILFGTSAVMCKALCL